MFRNDLSDVNVLGGQTAAGPRPSYRPAVEALEERIVLHDTAMPAPVAPAYQATPEALQALQLVIIANGLNNALTANPTLAFVRLTKKVEAVLVSRISLLELVVDKGQDPGFAQADALFHEIDNTITAKITEIKSAQVTQGILNSGVLNTIANDPLAQQELANQAKKQLTKKLTQGFSNAGNVIQQGFGQLVNKLSGM